MRTLWAVFLASLWTPSVIPQVSTGIDLLEQQNFVALNEIASRHGGQLRLAVLTNQVGIDAHERRTVDLLRKDADAAIPGLALVRLFSAEHGINGTMDKENVGDSTDPESGLPIVSL